MNSPAASPNAGRSPASQIPSDPCAAQLSSGSLPALPVATIAGVPDPAAVVRQSYPKFRWVIRSAGSPDLPRQDAGLDLSSTTLDLRMISNDYCGRSRNYAHRIRELAARAERELPDNMLIEFSRTPIDRPDATDSFRIVSFDSQGRVRRERIMHRDPTAEYSTLLSENLVEVLFFRKVWKEALAMRA